MTRRKIILTYLWLAPLMFGLITLVSYDNDIDDIRFGFPETFYSKIHGMSLITGQTGYAISFRIWDFLRDFGFALIVTLVVVLIYTRFRKKKGDQVVGQSHGSRKPS